MSNDTYEQETPIMAKYIEPMPATAMQERAAQGHRARLGHRADFRHVSDDGKLWHRVAVCCGEAIPDTVPTWADVTPAPTGE